MTILTYSAVASKASNGKGRMKPDNEGYVDIVMGSMNDFNSQGEYYAMKGAEKLFEGSSIFARRIKNGQLFSELSHPSREKGQTRREYFNRLLTINDQKVSTHIKSVELDSELWKTNRDTMSNGAIAVVGKIKPYGPFASTAMEAINTPSINLAYSVRSFTKNLMEKGVNIKSMVELVTWDQVGAQGIPSANKWTGVGLEVLFTDVVSLGDLLDTADALDAVGNESMADTIRDLIPYATKPSEESKLELVEPTPIWTRW